MLVFGGLCWFFVVVHCSRVHDDETSDSLPGDWENSFRKKFPKNIILQTVIYLAILCDLFRMVK